MLPSSGQESEHVVRAAGLRVHACAHCAGCRYYKALQTDAIGPTLAFSCFDASSASLPVHLPLHAIATRMSPSLLDDAIVKGCQCSTPSFGRHTNTHCPAVKLRPRACGTSMDTTGLPPAVGAGIRRSLVALARVSAAHVYATTQRVWHDAKCPAAVDNQTQVAGASFRGGCPMKSQQNET